MTNVVIFATKKERKIVFKDFKKVSPAWKKLKTMIKRVQH